jgi:hypothetical protein
MKTFAQLDSVQQHAAIALAKQDLKQLIHLGYLELGNEMELTVNHINYMASAAAEGSMYSDNGQPIIQELQS